MADPATFGHDRLGHLLSDKLLLVPEFQRKFSWHVDNIQDYIDDIEAAYTKGNSYFMGTIVLAYGETAEAPDLIVDGQQRIISTALFLIAIRDRLLEHGKTEAANSVESNYLSDYILEKESRFERLVVGPSDQECYHSLLGKEGVLASPLGDAYSQFKAHVDRLAPGVEDYRELIDRVTFLDSKVQVLVAVATGLAEAYIIFETLNDRGADLTTADLLKNFLFSRSGPAGINAVKDAWTRLSGAFDNPDDLVKFLRHDYMSRVGPVTRRSLYKAIQEYLASGATSVQKYLANLEKSLIMHLAIRDPDSSHWSSQSIEIRDAILAFRRFGFESSMPLMLAVFDNWRKSDATRFVETLAAWSVRSWFTGGLGGGQAEAAFCNAAVAVSKGGAKTADDVKVHLNDLVPDDPVFQQAIRGYGGMQTTRAKYLLAMLDRQYLIRQGDTTDALPDWSSKSVTIEHIFARSMKEASFETLEEYNQYQVIRDQIINFTLLERSLNNALEDKTFEQKRDSYSKSNFALTRELAGINPSSWSFDAARSRMEIFVDLAVQAWPK